MRQGVESNGESAAFKLIVMEELQTIKFPIPQNEFERRARLKQRGELIASFIVMAAVFGPLTAAAIIIPDTKPGVITSCACLVYILVCVWLYIRSVYKIARRFGMICPKCHRMINIVSTAKTRRCEKCGGQIIEEPS
jgi:hypothetical protein